MRAVRSDRVRCTALLSGCRRGPGRAPLDGLRADTVRRRTGVGTLPHYGMCDFAHQGRSTGEGDVGNREPARRARTASTLAGGGSCTGDPRAEARRRGEWT
ncbi:hypothetical protein Cpa01nite_12580 [Cellulomonas pakistanensis]|uniref:Uncharacterized protein n=1 Tax=Cellulomonas pakistanensis TaxID=992287 RepID=A0A919U6B7_9CELL|nr:hypothetical protein Cpa01nite_12580 [Cellulomonas pakistanensis]